MDECIQLVKKVGGPGEGGGDAEDRKEQGFKENYAFLKKLSEM